MRNTNITFILALLITLVLTMQTVFVPDAKALGTQPEFTTFREFIVLDDGRKVWVEADIVNPQRPTKLIFNGLTNSARSSFPQLSEAFLRKGDNVVRFDFPGQATTLLANLPMKDDLGFLAQVKVVVDLIPKITRRLNLSGRYDALGQSYGGGMILAVAAYAPHFAERYFRSLTAFAPYTEPLRTQHEQILREIQLWRLANPNLSYSDQELYDMIFYRTVMSSYWWAEPEILGSTTEETRLFLEGVHALAKGIRPYQASETVGTLPRNMKINVIMTATDQYIPPDVIPKFWNVLPEANRGYFIVLYGSEHKMLQKVPRFSADLTDLASNPPVDIIPHGSRIDAYYMLRRLHVNGSRYDIDDVLKSSSASTQKTCNDTQKKSKRLSLVQCDAVGAP